MRVPTSFVFGVVSVLLLTGCASPGGPMSTPSGSGSHPSFQTMPPLSTPSGSPISIGDARWQAILDDLAGRGVTATPTLVSAESITWSDSSLGCPKPGMMYSQVITPGAKVVVTADGRTWDYRFGRGEVPRLCQR